jgi:hypothetical protein
MGQKKTDRQQSTQHTHKTKDRVTRIPYSFHTAMPCIMVC